MKKNIAVIGAGSFGTAITKVIAENGHDVNLWVFEKDLCKKIKAQRENYLFLPDAKLPENVYPTNSLKEALFNIQAVVIVLPTQHIRTTLKEFSKFLKNQIPIIIASKGIEIGTLETVSQIVKEILPEKYSKKIAVLSGPNFAREVASKMPCASAVSSFDSKTAEFTRNIFSNEWFKIFINDDPIGAELGGALKNVFAIASGIVDGLNLGHNSRAALITRGLGEMCRIGKAMGAKSETFLGLSGVGDLVLTCTGDLSRNRAVGLKLAKGMSINEIKSEMSMIAEGVYTAKSAYNLAKKLGVRVSIIDEMYNILYEEKDIKVAISDLLKRDIVFEF